MANKNLQKSLNSFIHKIKTLEINSLLENLRNIKIEDLKNINFKRAFYEIKNSNYFKPFVGIFSASLMSVFVLVPKVEYFNSSFKTIDQYKKESENINIKIAQLKNETKKFKVISKLMNEINSSILKKEGVIFITNLLNEAAKKSKINIVSFSPVIKADPLKICKTSLSQKTSKKFSKRVRKSNISNKGKITSNFYEVVFNSKYLDLLNFFKEIQLYDVVIIPYCIEVDSEQIKNNSLKNNNINENESIVIPLTKTGDPLKGYLSSDKSEINTPSGNVSTRIIFKIPESSE